MQRGFSSVLLIVIVVMLAGMTTFALRFVAGSQGSAATQLQAMRAQRAAEAAIEWQRYRLYKQLPGACTASTNLSMPSVSGAFPVTVKCQVTVSPKESGQTVNVFLFTATACWPASAGTCPALVPPDDYVQRAITAQAACIGGNCTW